VPTAAVSWDGGSDHGAFLRAGVDAGLLIWDAAEVPYYHTPQDTVDTLQPERLREAGIVASHAALALIRDAESTAPMPAPPTAGRSPYSLEAAPR
jgi:Zn-dependent M28 family amino/carboxypeptidase